MSDLRLAWRVLRGGGRAGAARLILMVLGLALGGSILLLLAAIPGVLTERGSVSSARHPIGTEDEKNGTYAFQMAFGVWHQERVTRVMVADVKNAPVPPGLVRLPGPGETVLSSAAARLAQQDSGFARLVPGKSIGEIGQSGLLGPSELYAYVGVDQSDMGSPTAGRVWGGAGVDAAIRQQFGNVPLELTLLVAAPMVIYLNVCSRLSAATRTRRYAALRLLGLDRRRVLRLAALESGAMGVLGGVLALLGYTVTNSFVGPSGALGFTWFPSTSALSTPAAVAAVLIMAVGAGFIGSYGTSRALSSPVQARFDSAEKNPRWWYGIPFVLGIGLITFPLLTEVSDGPAQAMSGAEGAPLVVGLLCSAVGLLLIIRPLLVLGAGKMAGTRLSWALRVAARRVQSEAGGLSWHLAGLCVLVLTATIGAGVLRQAELSATPAPDQLTVQLYAQAVPPASREAAVNLPSDAQWVQQRSVTDIPDAGVLPESEPDRIRFEGVTRLFMSCGELRDVTGSALSTCQDGRTYRLRTQFGDVPSTVISPNVPVRFKDSDGSISEITTPREMLEIPGSGQMAYRLAVLETRPVDKSALTDDSIIFYRLPANIHGIENFSSTLVNVAPAATMSVIDLDLDGLEAYLVHRGVVRSGIAMALILGMAAFLISSLGRTLERRRQVAALVVVGTPARTLRSIQAYQLLIPLTGALLLALFTGHLAANALLLLSGQQQGWYLATLTYAAPLVAVALCMAGALSTVVAGVRPRPEDLRRE